MMRLAALALTLFATLAAAGDEVAARLEAQRNALAALEDEAPPDTVFQYNTGLAVPGSVAGALGGKDSRAGKALQGAQGNRVRDRVARTLGSEIPDINAGDLLDKKVEGIEQRLKDSKGKVAQQQKLIDDIKLSHARGKQLEAQLVDKKYQLLNDMDALKTQSLQLKGKQKKQVQKQLYLKSREFDQAVAAGKELQAQQAKLGQARHVAELNHLQRGISLDKEQLAQLKRAQERKAAFDSGSGLLGIVMTAVSSELEENAQAQKEGRRPLAINKVGNFIKGISGYSMVMGVMDNVENAKVQSVLDSVEFYERNGIDMSDPAILKHVEASARRAVIKAGLVEGAKLAPVIGDVMTIKEATDAAFNAYAAIEESELIQAGNEAAQFQTSLRTAVKIGAAADQMETVAAQFKLLTQALTKLNAELDLMQQDIATTGQQAGDALKVVADYNDMAQAAATPGVLASVEPAKVDALKGALQRIKGDADQLAGAVVRVKSDYAAGKIKPAALSGQARALHGKLDRLAADYAGLRKPLAGIRGLGQGAASAGQIGQAVAIAQKIKPVLQQQIRTYLQLRGIYLEQAQYLGQIAEKFKGMSADMQRYLKHLQTSKNIEEDHQLRIRAALDRAGRTMIDPNALRKVREVAVNLPTANEISRSLSALENIPQPQDIKQVGPQADQARAAWSQLAPLDKAADDSLAYAEKLLRELDALAAEASAKAEPAPVKKPAAVEAAPEPKPAEPRPEEPAKKEGGLNFKFKGKPAPSSSVKPGQTVEGCAACHEAGLSCVCGNTRCVCCGAGKDDWCDPN